MSTLLTNPLDELDNAALFDLLGQAWCVQFVPDQGVGYCIESSRKIGEREFMALAPFIDKNLQPGNRLAVMLAVTQAIKASGSWRMPQPVVAALIAHKLLGTKTRH